MGTQQIDHAVDPSYFGFHNKPPSPAMINHVQDLLATYGACWIKPPFERPKLEQLTRCWTAAGQINGTLCLPHEASGLDEPLTWDASLGPVEHLSREVSRCLATSSAILGRMVELAFGFPARSLSDALNHSSQELTITRLTQAPSRWREFDGLLRVILFTSRRDIELQDGQNQLSCGNKPYHWLVLCGKSLHQITQRTVCPYYRFRRLANSTDDLVVVETSFHLRPL